MDVGRWRVILTVVASIIFALIIFALIEDMFR